MGVRVVCVVCLSGVRVVCLRVVCPWNSWVSVFRPLIERAKTVASVSRGNWRSRSLTSPGQRAANIMCLIQTAKANGHDPMAYLKDVFERLPAQPQDRLHELLPHTWRPTA